MGLHPTTGDFVLMTEGLQGVVSKQQYEELMRFVVTENYLWNGGTLLRQAIGLPMGTQAAPKMANISSRCTVM